MASGANDRRGLVQSIREARRAYRGPFNGADIRIAVEGEGYEALNVDEDESFLVYRKDGCKPIPVNADWEAVWDNDPTFRCLQRDLGLSRSRLLRRLNEARRAD